MNMSVIKIWVVEQFTVINMINTPGNGLITLMFVEECSYNFSILAWYYAFLQSSLLFIINAHRDIMMFLNDKCENLETMLLSQ